MTDTANLSLPQIEGSQAQKHVTHNEALAMLDALVQLAVVSRQLSAPPVSPAEGARWIVAASPAPSGAWSGQGNKLAVRRDGGWVFHAPREGWLAYVIDEALLATWNATAWVAAIGTLANLARLGVNTTADATNKFAVKSDAVLLASDDVTPGSGDMRAVMSKAGAARTASLTFQTNYSGRAEMGLAGDDDWHLKVSADGAAWSEALSADRASGAVTLHGAVRLSGVVTPPTLTADVADYAPTGLSGAARVRLSGDAPRALSGLSGGAEGRILTLENIGAFPLLLLDASTASAAANRFALGRDVALDPGGSVLMRYDGASTCWRASERIAAAPFDAMAACGVQINGGMEVSQERLGNALAIAASGTLQSAPAIDGVTVTTRGSFAVSVQQVSDAPAGHAKSLRVSVTTAQSSLGASDELTINFPLEGTRVARLAFGTAAARPVSLAFWVKAHRTGGYSGALRNADNSRALAFSFAVNAADVWEYKTVTVRAGDASGTWLSDGSLGLLLSVCVAAGSSRVGAAMVWSGSDVSGASGTTNGVAATSDVFALTGLVVLPGLELPAASQSALLLRPYAQELSACERNYEKSYDSAVLPGAAGQYGGAAALRIGGVAATSAAGSVTFRTAKRGIPALTLYSPVTGASGKARDEASAGDVNATASQGAQRGFRWQATPAATGTIDMALQWIADARL